MHGLCVTAKLLVVQFAHLALFMCLDGSISKGAIYMLGVTSYEESRNRKNLANSISANDGISDVDRHAKAEVCVCFLITSKYRYFIQKSSFG